jgi:hypothetical protein
MLEASERHERMWGSRVESDKIAVPEEKDDDDGRIG